MAREIVTFWMELLQKITIPICKVDPNLRSVDFFLLLSSLQGFALAGNSLVFVSIDTLHSRTVVV